MGAPGVVASAVAAVPITPGSDTRGSRMLKPILDRRSVRRYTAEAVTETAVEQMLEAARLAPSSNNTQPWRFIVVRSEQQRRTLAEICHRQDWMLEAPVHVVCLADIHSRIPGYAGPPLEETSPLPELKKVIRDVAIAVEHLVLEAANLGLGTCWIAWFTQKEIRAALGIPGDQYVVAVVTVGHPGEHPAAKPRRPLSDLVRPERW